MKNKYQLLKNISLTLLVLINVFNVSVGFSFWDDLSQVSPGQTIQIGTGAAVSFSQTAVNFDEDNILIAENMVTRTSDDINTSIATTYTIDLVNKATNETITPYMDAGNGETWFAEVKIGNVVIMNGGTDVTNDGDGALRFAVDFIQDSVTTNGDDITVDDFDSNGDLIERINLIDNGVYLPTQFQVHLSIINLYTDAHSIALHGANVTYDIFLEIKKPITYAIDYQLNGGTNGNNPLSYTVNAAQQVITLVNPTRSGFIFNGWYENETFTGNAVTTIELNRVGDLTLFAKWTSV
jgi:uncharacterized repeat protein (TIGR02543 family)